MVNLVAGRAVVVELMQDEMRGERLASEALKLLNDPAARSDMRRELSASLARWLHLKIRLSGLPRSSRKFSQPDTDGNPQT